ncbi:hypothetical protein RC74_11585 [Falsihalocynthiibacter arcticus]|uniref:Uncharacterized protein n=1 Tax=Falsihalocynthiibacter arcticus TaxID=1579316 RepID=A0A126V0K4_9RHOB|nr:hypothetical protein RC74_11585 [Falsihalocynthiibacter arcticus]
MQDHPRDFYWCASASLFFLLLCLMPMFAQNLLDRPEIARDYTNVEGASFSGLEMPSVSSFTGNHHLAAKFFNHAAVNGTRFFHLILPQTQYSKPPEQILSFGI